jgi:hypothetical protein
MVEFIADEYIVRFFACFFSWSLSAPKVRLLRLLKCRPRAFDTVPSRLLLWRLLGLLLMLLRMLLLRLLLLLSCWLLGSDDSSERLAGKDCKWRFGRIASDTRLFDVNVSTGEELPL